MLLLNSHEPLISSGRRAQARKTEKGGIIMKMEYPGPYSENRTAAEIEAANPGVLLDVLPLSESCEILHREAVLILDNNYIYFDQHPYVRETKFGEPIWLSDHAGRCVTSNKYPPTHVTCVKYTRLYQLIVESKLRNGH